MADFLDPSSISPNISSLGQDDDPVKLFRCWIRQSCDDCISMRDDLDCSWCPFSSTCVPNPTDKYPLLAPIDYPDICPLGAKERWELRARGLGCNVSTRNFLSVVVAVKDRGIWCHADYAAVLVVFVSGDLDSNKSETILWKSTHSSY
ncbi:hypothetical protein EYB26_003027 [Talaromyces marneffei]|uniref:uncharacterized protein n=1 Tax=Talaromyces marneffei TaxID=37727 RepID=UPI0012A87A59|nr:uncharacterized protein EYB26_003027 [Talaromyces marneffei]QGA15370.1 hypothetical protein EYB26_003027 [Talaromyces marneffei]